MPGGGKLIAICQWGGAFAAAADGSLSYSGGDAHALSVDRSSKFEEVKAELAEMWQLTDQQAAALTIKYFLPNNRRTLITVSSDKDFQRMIDFHGDSSTVDVFVVAAETAITVDPEPAPPADAITPPSSSRSQRISPVDPVAPVHMSLMPLNCVQMIPVVDPVTPVRVLPLSCFPPESDLYETPGMIGEVGSESQLKIRRLWANSLTGLHQQFDNVEAVRDAIRKYAVAHGFSYKFKNNDSTRVSARCKVQGCSWRIYVSRLSATPLFRTKKFVGVHTCEGNGEGGSRPHASRKLVASIMKEKLRNSPNFKPKEIADQIQQEFGIELRYSQAWRGMETAKEELHGSYKEAYNHLPWLCEKILETNPGSAVTLVTRPDLTFHRLFIAMHASISGFQSGCRPLVFLDTVPMKSKYQTELLTATALDGNDGIFPLAFALVDAVNDDNWHWFLSSLKSAISTVRPLTFVADKRLRHCIMLSFENSFHAYCLGHLAEELKENLMTSPISQEVYDAIVANLYAAALSANHDGYQRYMMSIRSISPEAYEFLHGEPDNWANFKFKGSRLNHVESGIAASFYSWISEFPVQPITQIIDTIRQKMMETIYARKVESDQWVTKLTPSMEAKLQKEIVKAQSLCAEYSPTPAEITEVRDLGVCYYVCVNDWNCSCREWGLNGIPCSHAIVALHQMGRDLYECCARYYTVEAYRSTYSQPIHPVPTSDKPTNAEPSKVQVRPPPLVRLIGPPKRRRDRSKGKVKRPLHCSKCKGAGHNRATCHMFS